MCLLDEVLEGVSVCPLFGERRSVSHGGEVTQSEPVLHAFVPACHLLLFRLEDEHKEKNACVNHYNSACTLETSLKKYKPRCNWKNILFQSAASLTWSHTYLNVPCTVPASSAVHQSVSSDHNLSGVEHDKQICFNCLHTGNRTEVLNLISISK